MVGTQVFELSPAISQDLHQQEALLEAHLGTEHRHSIVECRHCKVVSRSLCHAHPYSVALSDLRLHFSYLWNKTSSFKARLHFYLHFHYNSMADFADISNAVEMSQSQCIMSLLNFLFCFLRTLHLPYLILVKWVM